MDTHRPSNHALATAHYLGRFTADFIKGAALGLITHVAGGHHTSPWHAALLFGGAFLAGSILAELALICWRQYRGTIQYPTTVGDIQNRLLAEYHRRGTRYEGGAITNPNILNNVAGELVGLRTAIGVAHGYQADTPEAHDAATRLYAAWLSRKGHPATGDRSPASQ
ncbi:hypothetical protein [Streptomyces tubercidicus]|uniref:hypothetical protein n=1 Tax=Streptomyces tubercidicus TaxID=47759 RepID=UPI003466BCDA